MVSRRIGSSLVLDGVMARAGKVSLRPSTLGWFSSILRANLGFVVACADRVIDCAAVDVDGGMIYRCC